jgi:two-component system response regulator MprA
MHAAAQMTTILIVEDNPELVSLLRRVLREQGYRIRSARDGETGLTSALDDEPDLLIVDVGLPRRSGFEVVHELRRRGIEAPMLMLTGRGEIADRITGLEAGADDYVVKPFDTDELVARIRALLRRASGRMTPHARRIADLVVDPVSRTVKRGDRELILTRREFSLLEYFMRHEGRVLNRAELAREVWRQTTADTDETNIVDVYIAYLRKKLDGEGEEPLLHTVRGAGYVLRRSRNSD